MAQNKKKSSGHLLATDWRNTVIIVVSFQFFSCSSQYGAIYRI